MKYSLGLDIGSVNAKLSLIDDQHVAVHLDVEKIASSPRVAVNLLMARLTGRFDVGQIASAGVSGGGKHIIPKTFEWGDYSSSLASASGILHNYPDARTVIHIGGQSSLLMEMQDGLKKPWKLASNSLCAAGTGRFLEQQAYRLGISLDDFATIVLRSHSNPPRIAARCSVFAKSDLIHLQQKGTPIEDLLYALCESVARMVVSLKKGAFQEPIYFVGGVAANGAVVRSLNKAISARNGYDVEVIVPENSLYIQSLGSALLARGRVSRISSLPESDDHRLQFFEAPNPKDVVIPTTRADPEIEEQATGYLGVDIGSTSTKAVILDESGKRILFKNYLMTAGRPIEAIKNVFRNLLREGAGRIKIRAAGVTGSGRYLVASFIGADLIKNEITAQSRAGAEIDNEADIVEIGGQDSKLILKRNGAVVDYQMNKACAAGTGSFIDELAEMLGISVRNGEFSNLAFAADRTIDLGTRCAAFMGQAVTSALQQGVSLEVVVASLANSIVKNYLSKVVGTKRLGNNIILTGAVFYNRAIVSAFNDQLKGKTLTVAEHREVSGAMGIALLAKESMAGQASKFRGFQEVTGSECTLSTFTCKQCADNCAITSMKMPGERTTFYGSRCERYDGIADTKRKTFFDERERLLFRNYSEQDGSGPVVGIPRALLLYDYAPMLIGFLNALNAKVIVSNKTTKEILEHSVELSFSDSCFPLKILHGHIASLSNVDYVIYPCAIRLGVKDGDENQKYACPLVQASPFIVNQALNLGARLLTPIIDFSHGDKSTVDSLADVATKLGFSRKKGREAGLAGIIAQRSFEADQLLLGEKLLRELRESGKLGVVLVSRSYMSQDSGANLGVAERLAQLGVVPIPLDFLPLGSVDPKRYSDRPYWFYESKFIAGTAITTSDSQLYGLVLTNFGCGPNSFTLKILEDITGGKPLGQLEIDEHAAEAGIITRLEAFVDTINEHARSRNKPHSACKSIYRGIPAFSHSSKTLLVPRMVPHAEVLGAAMQAYGVKSLVLPEPDERNLVYSNRVTSGAECLPYRVTLGDFMRFYYEDGIDSKNVEGFMAGSYGPCRLGKYAIEQSRILKEIGFDIVIRTSVSNNAYRDLNLGARFERLAWKGIVAIDYLQRLVWHTRPYETQNGATDELFNDYLFRVASCVRKKESFELILQQACREFKSAAVPGLPRKPLIGINGEIFLRGNRFSNNDLVRVCEQLGLEVIVSPMGEWLKYTSYRSLEDALKSRGIKRILASYVKKLIQESAERSVCNNFDHTLNHKEPSTEDILAESSHFISPKCGSEAVLSIGTGIMWMKDPKFAGVISVMPHGCMPGGIVAAIAEKLSSVYQKPWISLTYDGFSETNNLARIGDFVELVKMCRTYGTPS